MSKTVLTMRLLAMACAMQAADITQVSSTRVNGVAPAFSPVGRLKISSAEAMLHVPLADGTPTKGDFLVLFDSDTKRYLWREMTLSPASPWPADAVLLGALEGTASHAVFSSPDRISYWQIQGATFRVLSSTETARNLDEAFDKSLAELSANWQDYEKGLYHTTMIDFGEGLERGFLDAFRQDPSNRSAAPVMPPGIVDLGRTDNGYRIRLIAAWTGEVTVTDDFQVKERLHRLPDK
jgi:hypothetical protein